MNEYLPIIHKINFECQHAEIVKVIRVSFWIITFMTCTFYSWFIFDALGDEVGFRQSFWILIAYPMLPILLYGILKWLKLQRVVAHRLDEEKNGLSVEMAITWNPFISSTKTSVSNSEELDGPA
jgi:hypothetical protein